ncbi:MAG: hypothetical protein NUV91_04680 [Candidatus Omnitrophica bacterium]|nr:hypothetical protein [Candidatus Omnitrophota bacterium]
MLDETLLNKIQSLVTQILDEQGLVLFHFRVRRQRKSLMIEILIDRSQGGITIEQCTVINKKVVHALDNLENFDEDYEIEVSSPGMDWPLKTKNDFLRVVGQDVRISFLEPLEHNSEIIGRLIEVGDDVVALLFQNKKKGSYKSELAEESKIQIPLVNIKSAEQVI